MRELLHEPVEAVLSKVVVLVVRVHVLVGHGLEPALDEVVDRPMTDLVDGGVEEVVDSSGSERGLKVG